MACESKDAHLELNDDECYLNVQLVNSAFLFCNFNVSFVCVCVFFIKGFYKCISDIGEASPLNLGGIFLCKIHSICKQKVCPCNTIAMSSSCSRMGKTFQVVKRDHLLLQ